jgi:hypothetical protein
MIEPLLRQEWSGVGAVQSFDWAWAAFFEVE